jgi:hypothetical protein
MKTQINYGQHVSMVGQTGSGKTFAARNCWLVPFRRIIVVDTEEYDFSDFPQVSVKKAAALAAGDKDFVVRVVPKGIDDVTELCDLLLARAHAVAVYFDEVTDYSNASMIPDSMLKLIRKARKRMITVIVATQRPQLLNKSFLANSHYRLWFFIADYDTNAVKDYAPFLKERSSEIPYGSFRSFLQAPDGSITLLGPCSVYDWGKRLKQ